VYYSNDGRRVVAMRCVIEMVSDQTVYTLPLPISCGSFAFMSGVYTAGIGDAVLWDVGIDFYWYCGQITYMA